jgi:hypothetical protein
MRIVPLSPNRHDAPFEPLRRSAVEPSDTDDLEAHQDPAVTTVRDLQLTKRMRGGNSPQSALK